MTKRQEEILRTVSPPWIVIASGTADFLYDAISGTASIPDTIVRIVRGNKMRTERSLFDEFAAALQLPPYFGENWSALDECINDLSWLRAPAYIIGVTHATQLLADERDALPTLVAMMNRAGAEWAAGSDPGEPWARLPTPFHFVLQVSKSESLDGTFQRLLNEQIPGVGSLSLGE